MNILFASSEAVPFCKSGGLGDVAGSLARAMAQRGERVALFLPLYRQLRQGSLELLGSLRNLGETRLWRSRVDRVEVFFVDYPKYFDREHLYQAQGRDYPDNAERFSFFCRAVLEGAKQAGFSPELLHCHDWQTALLPAYLKTLHRSDSFFHRTATLLTIHNAAYQGLFPKETFAAAGFSEEDFLPDKFEYYGKFNFLKAGLVTADLLNTVSPTYAREIQGSEEFGRGLEGIFRGRRQDLFGILNGIDVEIWDPGKDPLLPRNYGVEDFSEGKATCRRILEEELGWDARPWPLVGIVSRMDPQKGLDMALEFLPEFLRQGMRLVAVGVGQPELEERFASLAGHFPDRVCFRNTFDEAFAHRIYAACDIFLMPSRFEPCGLGQMIAMRYGALPLGTRTGGLADTIFETGDGSCNGFLANSATSDALAQALRRALKTYAQESSWTQRVRVGMRTDFSWERSAESYMSLYRKAAHGRTIQS